MEEKIFDNEEQEQVQQEETKQEISQQNNQQENVQSGVDKIKELEKLYNQRLQELSQREKELEPLMQLQQYLNENPDKAQKIAQLLYNNEQPSISEQQQNIDLDIEDDEIKKLKKELENLKSQIEQQTIIQKQKEIIDKERKFVQDRIKEYEKMYDYFDPQIFLSTMLAYPEDYIEKLSDSEYQKLLDETAKKVSEGMQQKFENKFQEYMKKKKEIAEKTKSEVQPSPVSVIKEPQEKITLDNAKDIAQKLLEKLIR